MEIAANKTTPDNPAHCHLSGPLGSSNSRIPEQAGNSAAAREQQGARTPGLDKEEADGTHQMSCLGKAFPGNPEEQAGLM